MSSMMSKARTPDALVAELSPEFARIMGRLRSFVKKRAPALDERVKWGGIVWVGRSNVCYAHPLEDRIDFGFFRGVMLKDPRKILEGSGKFLRHVKVRKLGDFSEKDWAGLLASAVEVDA